MPKLTDRVGTSLRFTISKSFISSTSNDLVEHRKAVTEFFARMKRHFSAMEFFGSRADEAIPACRSEIDECSMLVGIYAWRYGWIPPNCTTSVTEQEFDYAQRHAKPVCATLWTNSIPGHLCIWNPRRNSMPKTPSLTILEGDVCTVPVDVLILKYAQCFFGADEVVAEKIGVRNDSFNLAENEIALLHAKGRIAAERVAFIGTKNFTEFSYREIREFGYRAAKCAFDNLASDRNSAGMTMHGVGFGLDEQEAFSAQVAGIFDFAAQANTILPKLIILERNGRRVGRMEKYLDALQSEYRMGHHENTPGLDATRKSLLNAGQDSERKTHIFVAVPYTTEMEDVYEFGIRQPINEFGLLCERCDHSIFTGDILARIKDRIAEATLVVADMTGGNPNVYLEVGYAWGRNMPTLLIAKQGHELKFDVTTQKCLFYNNINHLRTQILEAMRVLADET